MGKNQVPRCVIKDKNPKYRRSNFNITKDSSGNEVDKSKAPMNFKKTKHRNRPAKRGKPKKSK